MTKIAVLDDYQDVARKFGDWNSLPAGADVTVFNDHVADEAKLVERLRDFEIVCVMRERTPFPRSVFDKLPKLKMLVTTGARNASVDTKAAADHGVTITTTRGTSAPTPELAWALILALSRHIPFEHRAMQEGRWQTTVGRALYGSTLGLLGLGRLGTWTAKIGQAFGMKTIAWSQNMTDEQAAKEGVTRVEKDALFRDSDVLSIHYVLSDRSRGLVGARELGLMKPTAYLVNTSRGPIVDEEALVAALKAKQIAGAGLDTYGVEPLPADHPFRKLDNVVLTPHLGYVTEDTYKVFYPETVENVAAWMKGAPVRVLQS